MFYSHSWMVLTVRFKINSVPVDWNNVRHYLYLLKILFWLSSQSTNPSSKCLLWLAGLSWRQRLKLLSSIDEDVVVSTALKQYYRTGHNVAIWSLLHLGMWTKQDCNAGKTFCSNVSSITTNQTPLWWTWYVLNYYIDHAHQNNWAFFMRSDPYIDTN